MSLLKDRDISQCKKISSDCMEAGEGSIFWCSLSEDLCFFLFYCYMILWCFVNRFLGIEALAMVFVHSHDLPLTCLIRFFKKLHCKG